MKKENFLNTIESLMKRGMRILESKSSDYSGDDDVFKNFDSVEKSIGISSEQGIMVRMSDKINRVGTLLQDKAHVKDETVEDSLIDLANYTYILLARIQHRKFINEKNYEPSETISTTEGSLGDSE